MTTAATGTFTPAPGAAGLGRMVRAQARMESRLMLRNGEQLLLAIGQGQHAGLEGRAPLGAEPADGGEDLADSIGGVEAQRAILQARNGTLPQAAL